MRSVLIIGYGIVGRNMAKIFPDACYVDPPAGVCRPRAVVGRSVDAEAPARFDIGFVCVPTPLGDGGRCDVSMVRQAVEENLHRCEVLCVKSTVPPGFCGGLAKEKPVRLVFSPEYYGETQHANGVDYEFVILGGDRADTHAVAEAYKERKAAHFRIVQTSSRAAELAKYMENSFLATKVSFCLEFYDLARQIGVDYDELRELWLNDPRIGRSHTFVYEDHPFYRSKCFDKDIPAILRYACDLGVPMPILESVRASNEERIKDFEGLKR